MIGGNTCFIPIFGQKSLVDQWFLGNIVMSEYYTVFDMTPIDEGKDYVRVGIAKANPADEVGLSLLDKITKELTKSSMGVFILILISFALVGIVMFCLYRKRKNRQITFETYGDAKYKLKKHVSVN